MNRPPHRRAFVRTLVLGTSAGILARPDSALASADEPEAKVDPAPEPTEADARMQLVLARFGEHLDADARKSVRDEVEGIVRRAESLRKFDLDNGDAPMPAFVPYRAPLA